MQSVNIYQNPGPTFLLFPPQTEVRGDGERGYTVTLRSTSVAPFVWLDAGDVPGRFGSNGFLMASRSQEVGFVPWGPTSAEELGRALTVTSLRDVY